MSPRWIVAPPRPLATEALRTLPGITPLLATCLANRGHVAPDAAAAFLDPRLRSLADPFGLPDMDRAVARLLLARERGEPLVLFGDYDVDGVTSVALLSEALGSLGWRCAHYLPRRLEEGYGLSQAAVENCLARHPVPLLLAVDCGSTAAAQVAWLAGRGVDTVVLDHHQVGDPAPAAVALVNPLRSGGMTPFCSAGLAFKLAHALVKRGRDLDLPGFAAHDIRSLLDLVALGTVADLVPLVGENRVLVRAGLERLDATARPGLVALKEVAGARGAVGVFEVGFQLAPRLNAAGRLETAEDALRLLLSADAEESRRIAGALDARNRERQDVERRIADEVVDRVRSRFDPGRDLVIVEGELHWHVGVVGIVASRVLREFHRPTIILGGDAEIWRGSGRSIPGFDLAAALRACADLLEKHGGHAMAAGLSIRPDRVPELRERLGRLAAERLAPDQLTPELRLDAALPLREITLGAVEELRALGPFGMGNPSVQLAVPGVRNARPPRRLKDRHWKLWLTDGAAEVEAVWWGAGERPAPQGLFDVAAAPETGEFRGRRYPLLRVLDWRPAA